MRRHGLDDHVRVIGGDHTEAAGPGRPGCSWTRGGRCPRAVVAFNDPAPSGCWTPFTRAGVEVPGEVSVVGYDDSSLSRLAHVNLTTVSQDARRQAEHAVAAAVERLDGGRTTAPRGRAAPRTWWSGAPPARPAGRRRYPRRGNEP
jgi:DNA-binding LacI/PurR family transcriptional regulator